MCDKESSSHLVMFEIFDSLQVLYMVHTIKLGGMGLYLYMYYGIELDKLECINKNLYRRREYSHLMGVSDSL